MVVRSVAAVLIAGGLVLAASGGSAAVSWGLAAGLPCALSALGGAAYAEWKQLKPQGALAILAVGFLARMLILTAVALVALRRFEVEPLGFVAGFGVPYVVGQIAEIRLLMRSAR